jgi:hypothetical protein
MDLKSRNARTCAARGANFRGKVRKRRHVITGQGRRVRELPASELHAVAGIAR